MSCNDIFCVLTVCNLGQECGVVLQELEGWTWAAGNELDTFPYVCISQCKSGFKWYRNVQRCLRIVEEGRYGELAK